MGSRLALVLLLLLCGLRTARAKDLDVLPQETIVPQCTTLTALWSQTVRLPFTLGNFAN
jgi:hypothetical protein